VITIPVEANAIYVVNLALDYVPDDVMRNARRKYHFSHPRPLPIDGAAYRRRMRNRRKK
jgi:hypothetical protein